MNGLTKINAQWSLYSGVGFLTCLAVISPVARVGAGLIITGVLAYISFDTFKLFGETYQENPNKEKAIISAVANNGVDIALFFIFFTLGLFLGLV